MGCERRELTKWNGWTRMNGEENKTLSTQSCETSIN
jgi:hypothetical protein